MKALKTILCFLIVAALLPWAKCQFPRACTTFTSLKNKTCCPIPKHFAEPCGGDGNRGTCEELIIRSWNYSYSHFEACQTYDERHDWPYQLYQRACKCKGNFAGYDCGKCAFGYRGNNCTTKKTLTRRNFLTLPAEEKNRYMRYINESKYFVSDYVVTTSFYEDIHETIEAGKDPNGLFFNVTNYDLFTWLHYYSTRHTIYPDNVCTRCKINFAHEGQGFPTWHRLYLLQLERTLQEIANDEDFALPYWDWTENSEECNSTICSEDLLGVTNPSSGVVHGKYLDKWWVICTSEQTNELTKICNPNEKRSGLNRSSEKEREDFIRRGFTMTFPTNHEVNFALRFASFDLRPYNKESSCNFRNILEGYSSTETGYRLPNVHTLHNQVHLVVGGIMADVPPASNDPIFPLHHSFVDRIYEKWLRKFKKDASVLSQTDAPIGHNKNDVIVPMFPLYTNEEMFRKSLDFGYDYEDVDEKGNSPEDERGDDSSLGDCPVEPSGGSCVWSTWLLVLVMPLWQL